MLFRFAVAVWVVGAAVTYITYHPASRAVAANHHPAPGLGVPVPSNQRPADGSNEQIIPGKARRPDQTDCPTKAL